MTDPHACPRARSIAGVLAACLLTAALAAAVPNAAAQSGQRSPQQLLEDFNHYVFINRPDLAEAQARALLALDLPPTDFVGIVEDEPGLREEFIDRHRRALVIPGLEDAAADLYSLYESGRRERARSPEEIDRNVGMLGGTLRGKLLARERLIQAREYAVPALHEAMLNSDDGTLRVEARQVLQTLGAHAIRPLTAALPHHAPRAQEQIAEVLGNIRRPEALPFLYALADGGGSQAAREAARRAIRLIDGQFDPAIRPDGPFRNLADTYLDDRAAGDLLSFPGERDQLLWSWIPGVGLNPTAIRTPLFHEAMAMRLAERALSYNPSDTDALAAWLAANLLREIDQPSGYEHPTYPPSRREALYYAVAAGPAPVQRVLARALTDRDARLARRAIGALDVSAGSGDLLLADGQPSPLIRALSFPDRRVRFDAALAIAASDPKSPFESSERVVPIVAALVRDVGERYALVLADDVRRQQELRSTLEAAGFNVLAPAASLGDAREAISLAPGVDLILTDLPAARAFRTLRAVRDDRSIQATPALVLLPSRDLAPNRAEVRSDPLSALASESVTAAELTNAVRDLIAGTAGEPMTTDETRRYTGRALDVLTDLAVGRSEVLDVADAVPALLGTLAETRGSVRLRVAELLAHVPSSRAQAALIDAALAESGDSRVALLGAATGSSKRFGPMLSPSDGDRLVARVRQLARSADDDSATAAATLLGALNVATADVVDLILPATAG